MKGQDWNDLQQCGRRFRSERRRATQARRARRGRGQWAGARTRRRLVDRADRRAPLHRGDSITRAIDRLLGSSDGEGRQEAPLPFAPFSLDEQAEQARGKIEAPEFLRPTGRPLSEGLAGLKESRAVLAALRPRFDAADYSRRFPHPAFGPLNAAQWLAFVGMHEERHLRQIERILSEAMK